MDGWKKQRWEESEKRREEERRSEKRERESMKVREKVEKSRKTCFFRCFVAPEGCGAKHINLE